MPSDGRSRGMAERLSAHPFMLAPMAGVTDAAYRAVAVEHGAPLCYTEMVSVAGLEHASEKTWRLCDPAPQEAQVAVQLFGGRPEQFAPAARAVRERLGDRLALIDINMACPVPKVFKKGEGAALMADPGRACACLRAALEGAGPDLPVTCKIRAGIERGEVAAPEFARRLEEAGACAVAVHGRSARQLYTGAADWSVVARVAAALEVPVIGSGDVMSARDAVRMLEETGCAGVFVARGSYGNPWVFGQAEALLRQGRAPEPPSAAERLGALRRHIELAAELGGGSMARLRPVTCWYVKGLPGAAAWRNRAMACSTCEDFLGLVDEMEALGRERGEL